MSEQNSLQVVTEVVTEIGRADFPFLQFFIALLVDLIEVLTTPVIGYFLAIPFDVYLYRWAVKYLEVDLGGVDAFKKSKLELRNKLKNSLIFRIIIEYIPIINLLPISTIFVLLAYRDKLNLQRPIL